MHYITLAIPTSGFPTLPRLHDLWRAGSRQPRLDLTGREQPPAYQTRLEGGINFFDTANSYSDGSSEEIVGRALRDLPAAMTWSSPPRFHQVGDLPQGLRARRSCAPLTTACAASAWICRPAANPSLGLHHAD
jgi:hypothetical protein